MPTYSALGATGQARNLVASLPKRFPLLKLDRWSIDHAPHIQPCHAQQIPDIFSRPREPNPPPRLFVKVIQKQKETRASSNGYTFAETKYKRDSLATSARKSAKSKNNNGNPIVVPSKILAIEADARHVGAVYIAEAAGTARRVNLEVCKSRPFGAHQ